ncbi:MAG: hypothetical protein WC455_31310 [Dehalococcoidia bacterium]
MIVKRNEPEKIFNPFSITITFQSIEEAQVVRAIFNHTHIVDAAKEVCPSIDADVIRNSISGNNEVEEAIWKRFQAAVDYNFRVKP